MSARSTHPTRRRTPRPTGKAMPSAAPQAAESHDQRPPIDEVALLYNLQGISPRRQAFDRAVRATIYNSIAWVVRHWLLLVNMVLGLVVGGAFLVPLLYVFGWDRLGRQIFLTYHNICEQIPSHSYYLFGYQMALCARNLAIYGSIFACSLAFRLVRRRLPPLDWRRWLLMILPMALDGGTETLGWRETNWELRTLTGVLFGVACCWLILPTLDGLIRDLTSTRPPSTASSDALVPAV